MSPYSSNFRRVTAMLLLAASTPVALAQYVWTDAKGGKQYSDMPPPSSVPRSHILKQPGQSTTALQAPADDEGKGAPVEVGERAIKSSGPMTLAERNADFQKRKLEQAEKDKKAAELAKNAAERASNCARLQDYGRALDEGIRISTTEKNGERGLMSDEQRLVEVQKNQRAMKDCK